MFARPDRLHLLGAGHCGLAALALLAAAAVARSWPDGQWLRDAPDLLRAAQGFVASAIAYLTVTGVIAWYVGSSLRRGSGLSSSTAGPLAAAQVIVLIACAVTFARGPQARVLLAEGETALPAAGVISLMALVLNLLTWRGTRDRPDLSSGGPPCRRMRCVVLQWIVALAAIACLMYLESRQLPHAHPRFGLPPLGGDAGSEPS